MANEVNISSYIPDEKTMIRRQSYSRPPTTQSAIHRSSRDQQQNLSSVSTPTFRRTTTVPSNIYHHQTQIRNEETKINREKPALKPPTPRASSICADRRSTTGNNVSNRPIPTKNPQNWTYSLRSGNSSAINSESKTEKALREELLRLKTSFETYRKECNAKFERLTATNATFMEDLHELKIKLDETNSKFNERELYSRHSARKSEVNPDKLIDEISTKLLESLEFRDKVMELIEEHDQISAESEEKNEDIFDELPAGLNSSKSLSRQKRPTTIRDESWVQSMGEENDLNDSVEIIEDVDPLFTAQPDKPRQSLPRNSLFVEPPMNSSQRLNEENPANLTFTISESDDDELDEKENSVILKNLPVILSENRLTRSRNSPKPTKETKRLSTTWTIDLN